MSEKERRAKGRNNEERRKGVVKEYVKCLYIL